MPFILSHISSPVSKEQETRLKSGLGRVISLVPGKSEQYLLCGFEDNAHLYLRGDDSEPVAYIEAAIFGNESHAGYDEFTAEVCRLYSDVLGIAPEMAERFLYQLRYATIVETRPTARMEEILRIVRSLDIPEDIFENAFHAVDTMKALSEDIREHRVRDFIQPLIEEGRLAIREIPRG